MNFVYLRVPFVSMYLDLVCRTKRVPMFTLFCNPKIQKGNNNSFIGESMVGGGTEHK